MMLLKHRINSVVSELARKTIKTRDDFLISLRKLAKEYKMPMISNAKILASYKNLRLQHKIKRNKFFENQLKKRPIRSLSGVAVISVLTKPYSCPGKCLYCPTEKGFPKSYLAGEPAADRAKNLRYEPYQQVKSRIETLQKIGHLTDKIELIIIGGSFTSYSDQYKNWFIKRCFDGANNANSKFKTKNLKPKIKTKNLQEAQEKNEMAANRIISISIETRPDLITLEEVKKMRKWGVTKIELGIQTLNEKILEKNKRGHGLKEIIVATKLLKDAGFKVCYHFMPGLYGSTPKNDLAMFKKMFADQNFRPDYLKIYPCVVIKNSQLYKLWQQKKYKPYTDEALTNLLIKIKLMTPPYVRIIRIFRDIPSPKIEAGTKISNLRETIQEKMKGKKLKCSCIRCREIKNIEYRIKNIDLKKREYRASNGKEIFLSFEDKKNNKLFAFLRLRLLSSNIYGLPFKILTNSAMIRELHTYGELVEIGKNKKTASQHKNLGKKLVKTAEQLAKKIGYKKITVIAGVGSRKYWRKLGYKLQKTYMIKNI